MFIEGGGTFTMSVPHMNIFKLNKTHYDGKDRRFKLACSLGYLS